MIRDHYWLTEDQFSRLAPLLPTDTRGKARVDDRRVISGIVHVLKSGIQSVPLCNSLKHISQKKPKFVRMSSAAKAAGRARTTLKKNGALSRLQCPPMASLLAKKYRVRHILTSS